MRRSEGEQKRKERGPERTRGTGRKKQREKEYRDKGKRGKKSKQRYELRAEINGRTEENETQKKNGRREIA